MKPLVIVVYGKKQSGKDTFADILAEALRDEGRTVFRTSFAYPVKKIAEYLLGMPPTVSQGGEEARQAWSRYGKNAREHLQFLGTEFGRFQIHPDVWVHRASETILENARIYNTFVLSDGRFENETSVLRDLLPKTFDVRAIKIHRPSRLPSDPHVSEREIDTVPDSMFDMTVLNVGTVSQLHIIAEDYVRNVLRNATT